LFVAAQAPCAGGAPPVSNEQRAAAWLDIQEIVGRNKLRPGEAEMSPEDEEDFILQEIKAARAEERAQI
jgi:hypothetical protein